jgi:hypothetical protein
MKKVALLEQRNITDINEFESMLLDLEIDPDKDEYPEEEVKRIDEELSRKIGNQQTLLAANNSNGNEYNEQSLSLAPTDDEILEVAESTGVDLDVVLSAAAHVENLEALVRWVEAYKELESEQAIKDSARQQFEIDQLRKKERELDERLNAAINKPKPDINTIRQQLGVKVPTAVTNLGKWNGKPENKNEPDFLKTARMAFAKIQAT